MRGALLPFRTAVLCAVVLCAQNAQAASIPSQVTISICGDGIVNSGELCDEGVLGNVGEYASSTAERSCAPGCNAFGPYCGDDILQVRFTEQCDDGNNTSGDLCTAACIEESPVPPGSSGSPTVGSIPPNSSAAQGNIPAAGETRVVLRGRAYPSSIVQVLLDGKLIGAAPTDANAGFQYTASALTPGTATFGFWTTDPNGTQSITTSMVFEVVQSAVTTVGNIILPPTTVLSSNQVQPGGLLTVRGYGVPLSKVVTEVYPGDTNGSRSDVNASGTWAIQYDTRSLGDGFHTTKSFLEVGPTVRSGYGKSLSFYVGNESPFAGTSSDLNGDARTNLVDFSIFLLGWGSDDPKSDLNGDGVANLADFSILLFNWTG